MTTRTKYKRIFLLSLVVCMGISMTGCRESDEIQNIILTADAEEQDETEEMNPDMEGVLDENAPLIKEDPDSRSALEDAEAALQEDAEQDRAKQDTTYDPKSEISATASDAGDGENPSVTGTGDSTGTGAGITDTTAGRNSTESGKQSSSGDSTDSSGNQGKGDDGGNPSGRREGNLSDDPDARQVYDVNGNQIYLPEHVTRVAATGSAALIVQMLGGDGILCASNTDFLDDSLTQNVFSDEGITEAEALWDSDGASPMSDEAFERLLELYPDCCIGVSGETTFSESQIQTLKENDIPYLVIPDCSSAYNIETAVQLIGEALGDNSDNGGLNSVKLAEEYVSYEQDLVEEVVDKHGISSYLSRNYYKGGNMYITGNGGDPVYTNTVPGIYAGYVCDWDDTGYLLLRDGDTVIIRQDGLALTRYTSGTLSYYMSIAGIIDVSVQNMNWTTWPNYNQAMGISPFVFSGNGLTFLASRDIFNEYFYKYVTGTTSNKPYDIELKFSKSKYAQYKTAQVEFPESDVIVYLGDENYPALIVSSQDIKSKLETSRDSTLGLYRPQINVSSITTSIHDYYDIYVNPKGVGSWADGSVESVLESVWLSNVYYNGYTENEVRDEIKKFYSTFYRCDLSDSLVSDILEGPDD